MTDGPLIPPTPASPARPLAAVADRDTVLRLLESEIGLLTQRQRNTGWTSWAILGALGGIGWTLLEQGRTGWPPGEMWWRAFGALSLSAFALEGWINALKSGTQWGGPFKRFYFANSRGHERGEQAFALAYFSCLSVMLFKWTPFSFGSKFVALGFTSLSCLAAVGVLGMSFTKTLLESSPQAEADEEVSGGVQAVGILIGLGLVTAPAVVTVREFLAQGPGVLDIKLGALLAAAAFLTRVGLQGVNSSTTLENLLRIRRELALGGMTIEEAARRTELEFLGMRVSDVFRDSARQFMERLARTEAMCRKGIAEIDAVGLESNEGGSALSSEQMSKVRSVLQSSQSQLQVVEKELEQLSGEVVRINLRNARYLKKSKDAPRAMGEVLASLLMGLGEAIGHEKEFRDKLAPLVAMVSAESAELRAAEVRNSEPAPSKVSA